MKRLLAYLFIVLGLGLVFSVNSNAAKYSYDKDFICFQILNGTVFIGTSKVGWVTTTDNIENLCSIFVYKDYHPKEYESIINYWYGLTSGNKFPVADAHIRNLKKKKYSKVRHKRTLLNKKTQIAKKEPSQTQEVAKEKKSEIVVVFSNSDNIKLFLEYGSSGSLAVAEKHCNKFGKSFKFKTGTYKSYHEGKNGSFMIYSCEGKTTQIVKNESSNSSYKCGNKDWMGNTVCGEDWEKKQKAQIAKKEPKKKELDTTGPEILIAKAITVNSNAYSLIGKVSDKGSNKIYMEVDGKIIPVKQGKFKIQRFSLENEEVKITAIDQWGNRSTKVVKVTIDIKKEKKKVAKVVEQEQEEFKPEKKDLDKDPPVIEIAEAITFNDSDYEFEGKVTDKSKQIFIEIDGRLVDVKDGKFTVKGYSPVDKEISIEAIDGYGNRSKPKIVKIIIDIKDTDIAEILEPLNPSKIRAKVSKNKVALIIGIENYENSPKASYANLDAKYFFDYAVKAFGVKKQNINMLIDQDASLSKTYTALFKWLPGKIKPNKTDLIIFFSGHGLASSDGKEKYILPHNADPDLLSKTALSRNELFDQIVKLKPKSVIMFFDTCYSGVSRDEQMLLASARPIRIVAGDEGEIPDNFTIFSASKGDQISSGLKEAKHGIFSYYLMKGLEGKADSNKDYKITNGELLAYMDQNVSERALDLGRQQNPMLSGDPDQVLMSYR